MFATSDFCNEIEKSQIKAEKFYRKRSGTSFWFNAIKNVWTEQNDMINNAIRNMFNFIEAVTVQISWYFYENKTYNNRENCGEEEPSSHEIT